MVDIMIVGLVITEKFNNNLKKKKKKKKKDGMSGTTKHARHTYDVIEKLPY
jgi:hypothetical protein